MAALTKRNLTGSPKRKTSDPQTKGHQAYDREQSARPQAVRPRAAVKAHAAQALSERPAKKQLSSGKKFLLFTAAVIITAINAIEYLPIDEYFSFNLGNNSAELAQLQPTPLEADPEYQRTNWENPNLSWYEKFFCRGNHASRWCSKTKFLHPFKKHYDTRYGKYPAPPPHEQSVIQHRFSTSE